MNNRTAFAKRNLVWGLVNKVIMLFIPFLMLALLKKELGSEYLGLNNLFASLLQMLSLAEMGLGSAMVYALYKPAAEKNKEDMGALLSLYRTIYRVLSGLILVIGCACIPFLRKMIEGDIPNDANIYVLFVIYLANTALTYGLFAYKKSLLQAHQRTDVVSRISSNVHLVLYALQFFVLIIFKNYYLYVLLLPLSTIADNLFVNHIAKRQYPDIATKGMPSEQVRREFFSRVGALAGHKVGAIVITSFDTVVISAFLGLNAVAYYSNYFYIVKALTGIINILYASVLPGVGNSIILETKEHNYRLFKRLSFILTWFVGWASVCLVCLYQPFISFWMGSEYLLSFHTVILFVVYFYTWQVRVTGLIFKDAAGMWKEDFWKPYVGLALNLTANILLVVFIGMDGVIIATIMVMTLVYFPWETKVLFKRLFSCSAKSHLKDHLVNMSLTAAASVLTYFICTKVHGMSNFPTLLIRFIICLVVPNLLFLAAYYKKPEFKYVLSEAKKTVRIITGKTRRRQDENC